MSPPLDRSGEVRPAESSGAFVWFVYGSSLNREAFAGWARDHGYPLPDFSAGRRVLLRGFRLSFDAPSRRFGGAVASLLESPGDVVEGLALSMPAEARELVDRKEGAASGLYVPFEVWVEPVNGGPPIAAVAYRAAPARRLRGEESPSPAYLEVLLRGARASGLSPEWVARLESLRR